MDSFKDKPHELNKHEQMHLQALYAAADQMLGVLNGDRPDPHCRDKAIEKLRESVMWMKRAIEIGIRLP